MPRDAIVRAAAVDKCAFRLGVCAGNEPARIVGWPEYQGAASPEHVRKKLMKPERKVHDQVSRDEWTSAWIPEALPSVKYCSVLRL